MGKPPNRYSNVCYLALLINEGPNQVLVGEWYVFNPNRQVEKLSRA